MVQSRARTGTGTPRAKRARSSSVIDLTRDSPNVIDLTRDSPSPRKRAKQPPSPAKQPPSPGARRVVVTVSADAEKTRKMLDGLQMSRICPGIYRKYIYASVTKGTFFLVAHFNTYSNVADVGEHALAFASVRVVGRSSFRGGNARKLVVDIICARPRQGHGSKLMAAVEDLAARLHCGLIELTAVDDAIPFYKRLGFASVNGLPHRLMQKAVVAPRGNGRQFANNVEAFERHGQTFYRAKPDAKTRAPAVIKSYVSARGPGASPNYRKNRNRANSSNNSSNNNDIDVLRGLVKKIAAKRIKASKS